MQKGPLSGVVVADLSRALAGPHAAMMLGDLGARVIKVESDKGDDTRGWGPPFVGSSSDETRGESTYFMCCNRNKESIVLDLKSPDGRTKLNRLLRRADVVIENFRPGVLERLGCGIAAMRELNPRLVVLSITGFGHDGPEVGRAGYDQIVQGEAGLMSVTGDVAQGPTRIGVPIADLLAGMYGAFGVVAALNERFTTGRGKVVRTSLLASVVGALAFHGTAWTVAGQISGLSGNHHPSIAPYGLFRAKDGHIQLAVGSESLWRRFAPEVSIDPDEPRFATNAERVENRDALIAEIERATRDRDSESLIARVTELGVPVGKVRSVGEVLAWDQAVSQGLRVSVDHASLGRVDLPGPPLRFDDWQRSRHDAPPMLDQHREQILTWLEGETS